MSLTEQSQQYSIVERENEVLRLKVESLRELLKKCKTHLENSKSALWNFPETEILLTRINAAIGESDE